MFKAESNIVTEHGTIANGQTFNPDRYQIARKDLERWISIGLVSRLKSQAQPKEADDGTPDDTTPAPESSVVDGDDRRKPSRKGTK